MKKLLSLLVVAAAMLVPSAFAKSYTIIGGSGCGPAATTPITCNFSVDQVGPTGEYAFVQMESKGILFGNFQGPSGVNLGAAIYQLNGLRPVSAQVCSNGLCSEQVTELTAYIEGGYVDGTFFTGDITLHFAYVAQYQQGGSYIWERSLAKVGAGAVTINGTSTSVLKAHPNANDPCFGGQIVPGVYQPTGWRLLIADWWWGEACWIDGSVRYVIYDYPIL